MSNHFRQYLFFVVSSVGFLSCAHALTRSVDCGLIALLAVNLMCLLFWAHRLPSCEVSE